MDKNINIMINDSHIKDVEDLISSRRIFLNISEFTESLAHAISGIATILSFSSGYFNEPLLAFGSGVAGTISLVLLRYSGYAIKESKERTNKINRITGFNPDDSSDGIIQPPDSKNENSNSNENILDNRKDLTIRAI